MYPFQSETSDEVLCNNGEKFFSLSNVSFPNRCGSCVNVCVCSEFLKSLSLLSVCAGGAFCVNTYLSYGERLVTWVCCAVKSTEVSWGLVLSQNFRKISNRFGPQTTLVAIKYYVNHAVSKYFTSLHRVPTFAFIIFTWIRVCKFF